MADFLNPARISDFALALSRPDHMKSWSGYVSDSRFQHSPGRLGEVQAAAEGTADARDALRPKGSEGEGRSL